MNEWNLHRSACLQLQARFARSQRPMLPADVLLVVPQEVLVA